MVDEDRRWRRQDAGVWRAHHEAWKRGDLNQREYCEAHGIPLKAFGNWRPVLQRGNQDHASWHSNLVACAEWFGYRERK